MTMKMTKMKRLTLNKGNGMSDLMNGLRGRKPWIRGKRWLKMKMAGG
jgi:hypothetical protein